MRSSHLWNLNADVLGGFWSVIDFHGLDVDRRSIWLCYHWQPSSFFRHLDAEHLLNIIDLLLTGWKLLFFELLKIPLLDLGFVDLFSAKRAGWGLIVVLVVVDPLLDALDVEEVVLVAVED